ncbi:hypothetical protein SPRG_07556 [Saprolegnia parasitica CBS 223.65]|uniref:Uncharacterized protein n=1 Tax=Saprolegnia parasitica (strain CBS 223.65) TaxID=695850 RepID=A0A067CL92_SAPPC|nr:hypothetical protein SPRG_07556 [Saprolegnia parasitica CBS 223.65]KDO27306.1 hypothetical protein SPRG_07556 [Saprolegnia parasitica CBS 223.65]|eukprot:XP_012202080.1 hypothetical protein SPRG_07556 [Saprolegnia parasitica CBS 223.65]
MSSTGDDESDRSDDASDETGSVASSSEYDDDSDDEDSDDASDDDDDSSDDGDASGEESDDEEDNQAKELAEQKAKAVQDDVASILKMASSMDKICRRLQFKYGSNRKAPIALEPNPAKVEAEDEVPEALTPPKPTDPVPLAELPRTVMSDAATDSNDLEMPPQRVVMTDAATEPAAPVVLTALSKEAEHLMRNIEVQGTPKPVVPHIEKDCQLQLALATEPSLHLQEYMHPPPLLELPKRPRPFLATPTAPLRALSSIHSVPPELSESIGAHSVPIQRTPTSKRESWHQEPSTDMTGRADFGGQVDSPRKVVSDAATDSSDLEPILPKAYLATVPIAVTKLPVDRAVATTELAPTAHPLFCICNPSATQASTLKHLGRQYQRRCLRPDQPMLPFRGLR